MVGCPSLCIQGFNLARVKWNRADDLMVLCAAMAGNVVLLGYDYLPGGHC